MLGTTLHRNLAEQLSWLEQNHSSAITHRPDKICDTHQLTVPAIPAVVDVGATGVNLRTIMSQIQSSEPHRWASAPGRTGAELLERFDPMPKLPTAKAPPPKTSRPARSATQLPDPRLGLTGSNPLATPACGVPNLSADQTAPECKPMSQVISADVAAASLQGPTLGPATTGARQPPRNISAAIEQRNFPPPPSGLPQMRFEATACPASSSTQILDTSEAGVHPQPAPETCQGNKSSIYAMKTSAPSTKPAAQSSGGQTGVNLGVSTLSPSELMELVQLQQIFMQQHGWPDDVTAARAAELNARMPGACHSSQTSEALPQHQAAQWEHHHHRQHARHLMHGQSSSSWCGSSNPDDAGSCHAPPILSVHSSSNPPNMFTCSAMGTCAAGPGGRGGMHEVYTSDPSYGLGGSRCGGGCGACGAAEHWAHGSAGQLSGDGRGYDDRSYEPTPHRPLEMPAAPRAAAVSPLQDTAAATTAAAKEFNHEDFPWTSTVNEVRLLDSFRCARCR